MWSVGKVALLLLIACVAVRANEEMCVRLLLPALWCCPLYASFRSLLATFASSSSHTHLIERCLTTVRVCRTLEPNIQLYDQKINFGAERIYHIGMLVPNEQYEVRVSSPGLVRRTSKLFHLRTSLTPFFRVIVRSRVLCYTHLRC